MLSINLIFKQDLYKLVIYIFHQTFMIMLLNTATQWIEAGLHQRKN